MEFNLSWYLKGFHVNNNMDFREVYWKYERLNKKLKEESDSKSGMQDQFKQMIKNGGGI